MASDEQRAAFEQEFGLRPSDGLAGVHADMERTIVRNELADLRQRLDRARASTAPFAGTPALLEADIARKEAVARACDRL